MQNKTLNYSLQTFRSKYLKKWQCSMKERKKGVTQSISMI